MLDSNGRSHPRGASCSFQKSCPRCLKEVWCQVVKDLYHRLAPLSPFGTFLRLVLMTRSAKSDFLEGALGGRKPKPPPEGRKVHASLFFQPAFFFCVMFFILAPLKSGGCPRSFSGESKLLHQRRAMTLSPDCCERYWVTKFLIAPSPCLKFGIRMDVKIGDLDIQTGIWESDSDIWTFKQGFGR